MTNTTIPCTSICTGSLSIPAGLANVQMTLEDAGGKALSQGTTPVLIVSGQTNNVRFTLDGVVHSVSLQWVPAVLTSTAATTVALLVNALDVDGNVITYDGAYVDANDNQVVIKLSSPDATVNAALQSYAVSAPGAVITLPYSGESSITVTPTVTSGTVTGTLAGATLYASSLANAVWVPAYPPYSAIYAYVPPYTGTYVAVGASSNGAPLTYMAMDTSGNIFATENTGLGGNGVEEFSPPGYQGVQIISSGAGPIKVSASGYLFFGNPTSNIAIYAPPYTGAAVATIPMNASAVNFALDAAGNLYVPTTSGIAVYRPPYTGSPTTIAAANAVNTNAQTTVSFDGSQNLVANTANQAAGTSVLDIYAPPYTGTPANYTLNASIPPFYYNCIADGSTTTGEIACYNFLGSTNNIAVLAPPYTSATVPVNGGQTASFGNGILFTYMSGSGIYGPPYSSPTFLGSIQPTPGGYDGPALVTTPGKTSFSGY